MLNLTQYRQKIKGLPDLLNFAFLVGEELVLGQNTGIALTKAGQLVAAFQFAGPDSESSSVAELEALSAHLNMSLSRLGTGWCIHSDTVRRPAPGYTAESACFFPDPVSLIIDTERRQEYAGVHSQHAITEQFITLSWSTPRDHDNRFERLLVSSADDAATRIETLIARFRAEVDSVVSVFAGVTKVRMLTSEQLYSHYHSCLTADFRRLGVPKIPAYLDAHLGAHTLLGGFEPQIDDKHIAVVGISGFPFETTPVILEHLNTLAFPFRLSVRFIPLDPAESQAELTKYRRNWFQKRHSVMSQVAQAMGADAGGFENSDALLMTSDADAALAEAASGIVKYGYFTAVVIIHAETRSVALSNASTVRKLLDNSGFVTHLESINAIEALLGSLPSHTFENVRRPLLSSLSLVDLVPTTSIWSGDDESPNPLYKPFYGGAAVPCLLHAATTGNTPFRFNLHVGDLGHTLVAGPTGSGKSVLLALLMAQFRRYPNARVFSFDKGWSAFTLCHAVGGAHYDIGNDDAPLSFAPLSRVHESATERAFAEEWIETVCTIQGVSVDAEKRGLIHEAVVNLSDPTLDGQRGVDNLLNLITDPEIEAALSFYASTGRAGSLLSAQSDTLNLESSLFSVFELEHLLTGGESAKLVVVPVLMYLFHRVEVALGAGDPALIVLDEAWVMLDNPVFSSKIREWLKVLRKFNTAVIFATQSLSDLANSPLKAVLLESCPTKILLPNREAAGQSAAGLYAEIGLNEHQTRLLAASTPKQDYYIISPLGRRRIRLALGRVALAFTAVSSRKDVERVRELQRLHGGRWPIEHLYTHLGEWGGWVDYLKGLFGRTV